LKIYRVYQEPNHQYEHIECSSIKEAEDLPSQRGSVQRPHEQVKIYDVSNSCREMSHKLSIYERAPNVNIAQILSAAGCQGSLSIYERVPNVNIDQILSTLGCQNVSQRALIPAYSCSNTQMYEQVPDVNIAQVLSATQDATAGVYERAVVYEQVPDVNIAELLSIVGDYNRFWAYEGVSFAQTLPVTETHKRAHNMTYEDAHIDPITDVYEQAPDVNIAYRDSITDVYERAPDVTIAYRDPITDVYERAPDVSIAYRDPITDAYERAPGMNIAQLLAAVRTEIYERVPDANLAQILSVSQLYERVPNVNVAELLQASSNSSGQNCDRSEANTKACSEQ
jgi:hypothetical protein